MKIKIVQILNYKLFFICSLGNYKDSIQMCKNLQNHHKDNQLHNRLEYTCRIFQANPLSVTKKCL